MDAARKLARSLEISQRVSQRYQHRLHSAQAGLMRRLHEASAGAVDAQRSGLRSPWDIWTDWYQYVNDFAERSVLFWDTLRQRGNNYLEHESAGTPPVLHFDYEVILDARQFARPVNYALLRIRPPAGITVDDKRRPYVIIDPRAGHGPGIGGFKADSEVGVALEAGHPVYFVMFYPEPEPGQTLLDVTEAERQFVHKVRELHPESPKPALVGNCQGGWAAMMLAAADPDDIGPIVINGAPMSYWSGASLEGQAENPMRYAGGNLGGTWSASFAADVGNGVFDGAHLVQNFENLNPANTFWDKYYNLFANVDKEAPRFLDFERWWGGFFMMNREEIEWITRNLFVGNDLWSGGIRSHGGAALDLRNIRSPIILFASMGDNITPAQQAFNWVADVYGSTDEIKARGQVIVGLLHQTVGHLGIFVSGSVARKEHAQIVSVMKSIELLPPGLYGMEIIERRGWKGLPEYDVQFVERRLEEVVSRANRLERADEKPFEAVETVSQFNQQAYELFFRPLVQACSNDSTAKLARDFHPLRVQRWLFSDLNPWMAWLDAAAPWVRANRRELGKDSPARRIEQAGSEVVSALLDCQREVRDAAGEALFFQIYGNVFSLYLADRPATGPATAVEADARKLHFVAEALASIDKGGYAEAVARAAALIGDRGGQPLPLSELELRVELAQDYRGLLPDLPADEWRRVRGEQEIIVRYEREAALAALPGLLSRQADRERFLTLVERLLADRRVLKVVPTAEQRATLAQLQARLRQPGAAGLRPVAIKAR